jgi:hypothetical protein
MTLYENGRIPLDKLSQLDSGPQHLTTAKCAAMWYQLRTNVKAKHGVTLAITPGWNAYRPYDQQVIGRQSACAQGNCNAAASPGYSSHGGTWLDSVVTGGKRVDTMAFDIGNYGLIGQDAFYAEAAAVGFVVGAITVARAGRTEPWHIIVLDPYGPVPSGLNVQPFPATIPAEEDDMLALKIHNGNAVYSATLGNGVFRHLIGSDNPERVKNILRSADDWQDITIQELPVYLWTYGCDLNIWDVRNGDFAVMNPLDRSVKPGGMWSAENAVRAAIAGIPAAVTDYSEIAKAVNDEFAKRLTT